MILDVGVSDIVSEAANLVERKYPYPDRITAAGLGAAGEFRATFPKVTYTQIEANRPLPFPDKHFDIATSNAVLEHVGSRANQELFVREMIRVAQVHRQRVRGLEEAHHALDAFVLDRKEQPRIRVDAVRAERVAVRLVPLADVLGAEIAGERDPAMAVPHQVGDRLADPRAVVRHDHGAVQLRYLVADDDDSQEPQQALRSAGLRATRSRVPYHRAATARHR